MLDIWREVSEVSQHPRCSVVLTTCANNLLLIRFPVESFPLARPDVKVRERPSKQNSSQGAALPVLKGQTGLPSFTPPSLDSLCLHPIAVLLSLEKLGAEQR